jgi:hypothetical protein
MTGCCCSIVARNLERKFYHKQLSDDAVSQNVYRVFAHLIAKVRLTVTFASNRCFRNDTGIGLLTTKQKF